MKSVITLLLLCTTITTSHASSLLPVDTDELDVLATPISIKCVMAKAIQLRIEQRTEKVGDFFPADHARNTLANEIEALFNASLEVYQTNTIDTYKPALQYLSAFCVEQELKLFRLHYSRLHTEHGQIMYEYDTGTLRSILDFAQTEGEFQEPSLKLLSALKVATDRVPSRAFAENLTTIDPKALFARASDHGLVKSGEVVVEDITQLMDKLRKIHL